MMNQLLKDKKFVEAADFAARSTVDRKPRINLAFTAAVKSGNIDAAREIRRHYGDALPSGPLGDFLERISPDAPEIFRSKR